jgi:DNA-directed RNA polymerase subunit M/transcription elongation factor TFIIS
MTELGKCPKCGVLLNEEDIEDKDFRGLVHTHIVYVCKKCGYIIGFSGVFIA